MTTGLEQAIRKFRKIKPDYGTRDGATQQCYNASYQFVNVLTSMGVSAQVVELVLDEKQIRDLQKRGHMYPSLFEGYHYVVFTEGHLVDWTARQYRSRAPYPVVIPADGLELDWKNRRDACGFPRLVKK